MIVPLFWAEARVQEKVNGKQVTVRRFGWSNSSLADAQTLADERAQEAIARIRAGERLPKREPKISYNGAEGVPIREEVVAVHGDTILTRNSYGAVCLNTPNAFFIDIDHYEIPAPAACAGILMVMLASFVLSWMFIHPLAAFPLAIAAVWLFALLSSRYRQWRSRGAEPRRERHTLNAIRSFVDSRPDWRVRIYRTPAGLRLLVMHRPFDPMEVEVEEAFTALNADPAYVMMCRNQRCFRARVSPKPWRAGVERHLPPRPGVWPIKPERLPVRRDWIQRYEAAAASFASCRFLEELGLGVAHPAIVPVQQLHDRLSRANDDMPLA